MIILQKIEISCITVLSADNVLLKHFQNAILSFIQFDMKYQASISQINHI